MPLALMHWCHQEGRWFRSRLSRNAVVGLVGWAREVVAEATTTGEAVLRIECCDLGAEVLCGTNARYVGASVGEGWEESGCVLAVIGEAVASGSNTVVAACGEEGCSSSSELGEEGADFLGVGFWNGLFVVTIRVADDLREGTHI